MPQSRELANKKNEHKDRHSRGPLGTGDGALKKGTWVSPKQDEMPVLGDIVECDMLTFWCAGGAGAHNWGVSTAEEGAMTLDRNVPNYDSSEEK